MGTTCYICGKKHVGRGLCKRHYTIIRRREIDFNDRDLIIKTIEALENKECFICGKERYAKDLCKNHYEKVRIRGIDLNDKELVKKVITDLETRKLCVKCGKYMVYKDDLCTYCFRNLKGKLK